MDSDMEYSLMSEDSGAAEAEASSPKNGILKKARSPSAESVECVEGTEMRSGEDRSRKRVTIIAADKGKD
jgi:hypothetical protein